MPSVSSVTNTLVTVGAESELPGNFRVVGEFARSVVPGTKLAPQGTRGYFSLLGRFGKWKPYVTYAFLRSPAEQRRFYNNVNDNTVPDVVPGAALLNASQRAGADLIPVFDQSSWAAGTSYVFSASSRLKAEIMRTQVGDVSTLVDAPPAGNSRHSVINVISLSYSVVF